METNRWQAPMHENLHLRLFTTQCIELGPWWRGPHYNNFWRLYVNTRGGGAIRTEDSEFRMAGRRVYIVPAWNRFTSYGPRGIDHCYAHFDVVGLPVGLLREFFNCPVQLKREARLDACVRWWTDAMTARRPVDLYVLAQTKALIYMALGALLAELPADGLERCARHLLGRQAMTAALEYIENHLGEPLDNALLGQVCHVSRDHLIRLFRNEVGQTPAQFILERRISRAAQQLIFSQESIDHIAENTGFLDRFHFSRTFAARMGVPPARYRKTASRY